MIFIFCTSFPSNFTRIGQKCGSFIKQVYFFRTILLLTVMINLLLIWPAIQWLEKIPAFLEILKKAGHILKLLPGPCPISLQLGVPKKVLCRNSHFIRWIAYAKCFCNHSVILIIGIAQYDEVWISITVKPEGGTFTGWTSMFKDSENILYEILDWRAWGGPC